MKKQSGGLSLIELLVVLAIVATLCVAALPRFQRAETFADVAQAKSDLQTLAMGMFDYHTALISAGKDGAFPPGGAIAQAGWSAWRNSSTGMDPNSPNNEMHACSFLWVPGSFYADKTDSRGVDAEGIPGGDIHYDLRVMTSPIEALTSVPRDPFKESGPLNISNQLDCFVVDISSAFVFRSLGPDGTADVGCGLYGFDCQGSALQLGNDNPSRPVYDGTHHLEFGCAGCTTLEEALRVGASVYSPTNGAESIGDIFRVGTSAAIPDADFNNDGEVDFKDLTLFGEQWQNQNGR